MTNASLPKEIMQEIADLRKRNVELHDKYCNYIIEDESFKDWEDWAKQRIIDMFNGVLYGSSLNATDDSLQMGEGNIKSIFLAHGIDIEECGENGRQVRSTKWTS